MVLLSDQKVHGMINFKDLYELSTPLDIEEMHKREKAIDFEDVTNI